MRVIGKRLLLFMGRHAGGNKVNTRQRETFPRRACQRQVPAMNGIKGSAKQADVHNYLVARPRILPGQHGRKGRKRPALAEGCGAVGVASEGSWVRDRK